MRAAAKERDRRLQPAPLAVKITLNNNRGQPSPIRKGLFPDCKRRSARIRSAVIVSRDCKSQPLKRRFHVGGIVRRRGGKLCGEQRETVIPFRGIPREPVVGIIAAVRHILVRNLREIRERCLPIILPIRRGSRKRHRSDTERQREKKGDVPYRDSLHEMPPVLFFILLRRRMSAWRRFRNPNNQIFVFPVSFPSSPSRAPFI